MFKPIVAAVPQDFRPVQDAREGAANHVFKVLHGYYGNMLFSKYATGKLNAQGEDEGIISARRIWDHGLQSFDGETLRSALRQCQDRHPEFPPSLPQFLALCEANRQRGPRADANNLLLGMAPQLRSVYAAQARAINAKHTANSAAKRVGIEPHEEVPATLDGLKQALADAALLGGGDEAAELLRLDRMLAKK